MKLIINGEEREVSATNVLALLAELGLNAAGTVVERNKVIVERAAYQDTGLAEGDLVEIVRLVGGG